MVIEMGSKIKKPRKLFARPIIDFIQKKAADAFHIRGLGFLEEKSSFHIRNLAGCDIFLPLIYATNTMR